MIRGLIVALLAVLCAAAAARASDKKAGEARLQKLLDRSAERPLISLNGRDFDDLVGGGPRPYRLLAWVTSNSGSCSMCNEMRGELDLLAATYELARYRDANGTRTDTPQHRVFLVELDGTRNFDFFKTLEVKYIPHLYHVPPTKTAKRRAWPRLLSDEVQLQGGWKAEDIERNLRSKSRLTVSIERPPEPINWAGIITTVLGGGLTVAFFSTIGRPALKHLTSPHALLAFSFLFFAFCVSGGMYNRIRNVPWDDGRGGMFASGARGQFGAESVLVGFLYICLAVAIIVLNTTVHSVKAASTWSRSLFCAAVLGSFVFLWRYMLSVYTIKNGGYNNGHVWRFQW